jgi:kynureninase
MIFSQATCPMVMSFSSLTSVCSLMVTTYPVNDVFVVTSALSVGGKFVVDSLLTISVALTVSNTLYH